MAEGTLIEWARHPVTGLGATWNIVTGCDIVSPGCTNCYAMKLAGTRLRNHPSRKGLTVQTKAGPVWNGEVRFNEQWLTQPMAWKKPHGIFVAAHGDLFAEGVTDEQLDRIFAVMALCPQHVFYVLTKRPERMRDYIRMVDEEPVPTTITRVANALHGLPMFEDGWTWPLQNVWLGVSVEDQKRADERISVLLDTPAAVRFISAEPLLGPIDLTSLDDGLKDGTHLTFDALTGLAHDGHDTIYGIFGQPDPRIDWVIAGGESGSSARPSHPDWFRWLRDDCAETGTAFFFKQWGVWTPGENVKRQGTLRCASWFNDRWDFSKQTQREAEECHRDDEPDLYDVGKKEAGRLLDGVEHTAWPELRP
jgi:protein gp37